MQQVLRPLPKGVLPLARLWAEITQWRTLVHSEAGYRYRVDFDGIRGLTGAINSSLAQFFEQESFSLREIGGELNPVADSLGRFLLDSGKRLRPLFATIGFIGVGGYLSPEIIRATASLELVHVCALIHDDVMDASDTRRGAPAIHKQFETLHGVDGLHGSSEQFGMAAAILLGDLQQNCCKAPGRSCNSNCHSNCHSNAI